MRKLSIREWAKEDRPREKLMLQGPQSLSIAELLSILIQNGTPEFSALDVAKNMLLCA
jgi:DNA repair protein RadC